MGSADKSTALTICRAVPRPAVTRNTDNADANAYMKNLSGWRLKGNEYRLLTLIDYDAEIVDILAVLTHAEYDKDAWKLRY